MNRIIKSIIIGLSVVFIFAFYADVTQADLADNFVRLHVIANSDEKEDQILKLKVRDRIIKESNEMFESCTNKEEIKKLIDDKEEYFKEIAENEIDSNGKNYNVEIKFGTFYFPTKQYGDVILPSGEYEALKVIIGKGEGKNWWCVLFPPLCFVDATHGEMSAEVREDLKENLTEEQYKLLSKSDEQMDVKVKFKIIEVWNSSKEKVKEAFNQEGGTL